MIWPTMKKYGKYVAILLLGIGSIVLFVMVYSWMKKKKTAEDGSERVEKLEDTINEIGEQLKEAKHQAAVEIKSAREEEKKTKEDLEDAVAIEDKTKRRKRLAELYSEL